MTDEVKMIRDIYKMIGEETNSDTVRELVSKYKQLQQENQQLKEKLLKIFENIDISYNEWKKWKGELSKLKESKQ